MWKNTDKHQDLGLFMNFEIFFYVKMDDENNVKHEESLRVTYSYPVSNSQWVSENYQCKECWCIWKGEKYKSVTNLDLRFIPCSFPLNSKAKRHDSIFTFSSSSPLLREHLPKNDEHRKDIDFVQDTLRFATRSIFCNNKKLKHELDKN